MDNVRQRERRESSLRFQRAFIAVAQATRLESFASVTRALPLALLGDACHADWNGSRNMALTN